VKRDVLVVACRTATSDDLLGALQIRAAGAETRLHFVIPAPKLGPAGERAGAEQLAVALQRAREAGLEADGVVGDPDPVVAVCEAYDPRRHDEIVVSTLPAGASRWLASGLPMRIARMTDAVVTHVVSRERAPVEGRRPPAREAAGALSPLRPLTWAGRSPAAAG
jgi:hypothetical protein